MNWAVWAVVIPVSVGLLTWYLGVKADNKRHREALAADNARHLEDIKRENEQRKADAEADRLQREADYQKQKELFEGQRNFYLSQEQGQKNSLILAILSEIHKVQEFLILTPILYAGSSYSIEAGAIFGTVSQQSKSFQNETLIRMLTEYRGYMNRVIEVLNKVNAFNPMMVSSAAQLGQVVPHGNWNSMNNEGKRLNASLLALLSAEYCGDVPENLKTLRMG
jgi:hypothetical protein